MAQVAPIRPQPAAPPPAPAAPPPAPPPAPDNSIGFAVSRPTFAFGILLSVVIAMLIYVAGFLTGLILLVPDEPPQTTISEPAKDPAIAALPVTQPALPAAATTPPAAARQGDVVPAAGQDRSPQTPTAGSAASEQPAAPPSPPAAGPGATPPAAQTSADAAAPAPLKRPVAPPVPTRLADSANLLRAADGRLSLPPRPSLPPAPILLRRSAEAAANAARDGTPQPAPSPPAVITEAKQLPVTRENALLTPPPAKPTEPGLKWTLQAGAFLGQEHAERLVAILKDRGHDAHILQTTDNRDRIWYRVRFGSYSSRGRADDAAREFRRKEGRDAIVVRRLIDAAEPAAN